MPEYAIVTPVPPQQTGIADYAAGLIRGLRSRGNQLTAFTQGRFVQQCDDELGPVHSLRAFDPARWSPRTTIYQFGNNIDFHDDITLHFLEHGGIVHLHDFALHHLFAQFTFMKDCEVYYALIAKWYGAEVSERIRRHHSETRHFFWDGPEVVQYPLNEEIVSRAAAVVVHSEFARARIQRRFAEMPVYVVPQRYPEAPAIQRKRGDGFNISSLGSVDPFKRVDRTIHAIAKCRDRGVDIRFDVVGRLHPLCAGLPDLCRKLKVEHLVTFRGAVPAREFAAVLAATDLCVALREPTVGETSAITSRALQYGVPLIVLDIGSYAELPAPTIKIPPGPNSTDRLADHLFILATNDRLYANMADAAYAFAASAGTFAAAIDRYAEVIRDIGSQP